MNHSVRSPVAGRALLRFSALHALTVVGPGLEKAIGLQDSHLDIKHALNGYIWVNVPPRLRTDVLSLLISNNFAQEDTTLRVLMKKHSV